MGVDHSELSGFTHGSRRVSVAVLDKIVAWLDEQDALDEQARKGS